MKNITFIAMLTLMSCVHVSHFSLPYMDGGCPSTYPVKGNMDSYIYHTKESKYYDKTLAEICFTDVEVARDVGYRSAKGTYYRPYIRVIH